MPLDATVGGATSNSYVDVAYADVYHADRPTSGDWTALTTAVKEQWLIAATRDLDLLNWMGIKATSTQSLRNPRSALCNADGELQSATALIDELKEAVSEQALYGQQNESAITTVATGQIKKGGLGPIEVEYNYPSGTTTTAKVSRYSSVALLLLKPYLRDSGSTRSITRS